MPVQKSLETYWRHHVYCDRIAIELYTQSPFDNMSNNFSNRKKYEIVNYAPILYTT